MKATLDALSTARSESDLVQALSRAQRQLYDAARRFASPGASSVARGEDLEVAAEAYAIARNAVRAMDGVSS